jgi:SAM-dependent methyltransferase
MSRPAACPICGSEQLAYVFVSHGHPVCKCQGCSLMLLNPQPDDQALADIYSQDYFLGEDSPEGRAAVAEMKKGTAELYLQELLRFHGPAQGKLLEVGCGRGDFMLVAQKAGFEVSGIEFSQSSTAEANARLGAPLVRQGDLDSVAVEPASIDACVLFDVLEHPRDPVAMLAKVHTLLKPGGTLFVVTPSLDTLSAKLMQQAWVEFKPEHLFYFDSQTVQHALAKTGFAEVEIGSNSKFLTFDYLHRHFEKFPVPLFSQGMAFLHFIFPKFIKDQRLKIPSSGMNVLSRKAEKRPEPLLSIIVPVYNEAKTFPELMKTLLDKSLPGLGKEIIVVESNSKDGTRDEVLKFKGLPGVKIVLEERPQGKGHAVRSGLKEATGDIVMIQDGDLEYDINDYDQLLEPLRNYQAAVVLGSRHSGSWKIRSFTDQPLTAAILNTAHFFFAWLINVSCGSKLKDPFTMYKLFRRDCIHNLAFKANRFDFDWEIMIKLLRKGYRPLEIPVNYRSRSFKEGKKVRLIRDPISWIWALIRFRTCPLYEKSPRPVS